MSIIDEITNSIKAELYDRSVSPLMGSFIISWLIWNHEFLLIIFSELKIDKKLSYTSNYFQLNDYGLYSLWLPLLTSLIYLFAYPIAAKPVFKYARKRQQELKQIKTQIEDETPLTIEESRALRSKFSELEDEYLKEIERKNRENERLKEELKILDDGNEIDKKSEKANVINIAQADEKILSKAVEKVLLIIAHSEAALRAEDIINIYNGSTIEAEHAIDTLTYENYIFSEFSPRFHTDVYKLARKGRAYIVDNNLHKTIKSAY